MPFLGDRDVTGGISNVILVLRRECYRKCLMRYEALCSHRPDVSEAARGRTGFVESHSSPSGIGESPVVQMKGGYNIKVCVGLTNIYVHAPFHAFIQMFSFFSFGILFSPSSSCGSQLSTVFLIVGRLSHLAGEVSHFSLLHNLWTSDKTQPQYNHRLILLLVIYLRSECWNRASGCSLTGKQQSVTFYHLGCTGISTTRVPDLDTSLAINDFRTLAACWTGQDKRQSARPAANMVEQAFLFQPPVLFVLCVLVSLVREQYGQSRTVVIVAAQSDTQTVMFVKDCKSVLYRPQWCLWKRSEGE